MRKRSGQRGNSAIELAVSFALIFSIFTGTYQFGYSFYLYNRLETAVRSGARYASLRDYDSVSSNPSDAFRNAVRNTVVYGDPAGGTQPIVPSLTTEMVRLNVTFTDGVPTQVSVSIRDYTLNALFQSYSLSGKPSISFPYVGRYAGTS